MITGLLLAQAETSWFDGLTTQTVQLAGVFGLLVLAAVRILLDTRRAADVDQRAGVVEQRADAVLEEVKADRDWWRAEALKLRDRASELERALARHEREES